MAEHDEHRVRQRAHAIWEQEGRPEGRHRAHWDQAREEIVNEDRQPSLDLPRPAKEKAGTASAKPATGEKAPAGKKLPPAEKAVAEKRPAEKIPAEKPSQSKKVDAQPVPAPRRRIAKITAP